MIAKIQKIAEKIWGSEIGMVKMIEDNGKVYAECETTLDHRHLTETNCEEVLNDMFYDYCVENADWMGVS